MSNIDTIGSYRGTITEAALGVTKKSGYPQAIFKLEATEKWVDDKASLEHFGIQEPAWVDWSDYGETITAYLVLFKASVSDGEPMVPGENSLLNYELLQRATGWDGAQFDTLNDDSLVDRVIQFRVGENEYEGKTSLQVEWIDEATAPVNRALTKLDADKVTSFNNLLKVAKKAPAPARPSKPGKATASPAAAKPSSPPAPKAAPRAKAKAKVEEPTTASEEAAALPAECSQMEAWNFVIEHKGDSEDTAVEEAWVTEAGNVAGDRDESALTPADWAKVRDAVVAAVGIPF